MNDRDMEYLAEGPGASPVTMVVRICGDTTTLTFRKGREPPRQYDISTGRLGKVLEGFFGV
jgi:hypothetical protein